MVEMSMKRAALLGTWLIGGALCSLALTACGDDNGRPGSVVSGGGASGASSAGRGGSSVSGDAGGPDEQAGSAGSQGGEGGVMSMPETPYAVYPKELPVDAGCGMEMDDAMLLIQNQGAMPLVITSATADSGYMVSGSLPLTLATGAGGLLLVTPPEPAANANAGETSEGTLTFTTNEPGSPSHRVTLKTTLYGAKMAFASSDGVDLAGPLTLTYLGSSVCPSDATYRVQNTGNVAFTLKGPTFPAAFGGRTTGENGVSVAPGSFTELKVGPSSGMSGACSGSGELTFVASGAFCGAVPKLLVSWPSIGETSCACMPANQ